MQELFMREDDRSNLPYLEKELFILAWRASSEAASLFFVSDHSRAAFFIKGKSRF
jgi:hypothetical protein